MVVLIEKQELDLYLNGEIIKELTFFTKYFNSVEARRATYKNWVFSGKDPCNPDALAEAGFIFIGTENEPDAVQCFVCHKMLDGWERNDDPWKEHIKHQKDCPFAAVQMNQNKLTFNNYIKLENKCVEKIIMRCLREDISVIDKIFRSLK